MMNATRPWLLLWLAVAWLVGARPSAAGPYVVPSNVVVVYGYLDLNTAARIAMRATEAVELGTGGLFLLIHSSGGTMAASLLAGATLDVARVAGVRVVCLVPYKAHSAAFTVLQHCDERLVGPDVQLSQHRPVGASSRSRTAWLTNRATCRTEAMRMGVPVAEWARRVMVTVGFDCGEDAVLRGAADRVVRPVCPPKTDRPCALVLVQLAGLVEQLDGKQNPKPVPLLPPVP